MTGPLAWFWGQVEGNALWSLTAVALAVIFRKRLARWWHRVVGESADIEDIRAAAAAAHRIAADLFEHHCGRPHELAPGEKKGTP